MPSNIVEDAAARRFCDCDYIFLAADTHQARCVFNALVHQFLIPGVQIGTRIRPNHDTGDIDDVFVNVRPVTPDFGCLWCAGLIDSRRLALEAMSEDDRRDHDYIEGEPAASVVTLNNVGVGLAVNDFLFGWTGLLPTNSGRLRRHLRYWPREHKLLSQGPHGTSPTMYRLRYIDPKPPGSRRKLESTHCAAKRNHSREPRVSPHTIIPVSTGGLAMMRHPNTTRHGHSFSPAIVEAVWQKGVPIAHADPRQYRRDQCGALMHRDQHGNTRSPIRLGGRPQLASRQER